MPVESITAVAAQKEGFGVSRRQCAVLLAAVCGERVLAKTTDAGMLVERESSQSVAATLERVVAAIEAAGLRVFARIDHAAAAREFGLLMPPTTVVIYGNPVGGTPVMLAAPEAALDLPLHVLVREGPSGQAIVAFRPIAGVLQAAGVPEQLAKKLVPAQTLLLDALGARP